MVREGGIVPETKGIKVETQQLRRARWRFEFLHVLILDFIYI